jgi:hypothetical protein
MAAAWVRAQSGHMIFVVDKVALGRVFSEHFGFPCQSSFHQILHPHNHPGHVQWIKLVADPVGLHHPLYKIKKKLMLTVTKGKVVPLLS